MENKQIIISIGSGGMNVLNDIKIFNDNLQYLYINEIDFEAKEDGLIPIFDKIDQKEKIIIKKDNVELKLRQSLENINKANIIITLASKTLSKSFEIIKFITDFLDKVTIYAIAPFDFEDEQRLQLADESLQKIKQITSNIHIFYNDEIFKNKNVSNMQELFQSMSKKIYTKIESEQ